MTSPSASRPSGPPRLGPRPLPLHLTLAATSWLTSPLACALWSSGSLAWKPPLADAAAALTDAAGGVALEHLLPAVEAAARGRFGRFLHGVEIYRHHPYRRTLADPPVRWQDGPARLLDYGADLPDRAPVLLVVPSLVNRAYILDLTAERSLLRYLAAAGVRPLLVDWGYPGSVECRFTLTDYVAGQLEAALDAALALVGGPIGLAGYCMGGLLAAALACRRPRAVRHLVLLATPWDFHADPATRERMAVLAPGLGALAARYGELPADGQNALFAGLDPFLVLRKFAAVPRLADAALEAFVALEDWLNDGVRLAGPVAEECLTAWYGRNAPATLGWRIAGRPVDPGRLGMPALVVIPSGDRIVPPASAQALAAALPRAQTRELPLGHIGLMASGAARDRLWRDLAEWCHGQG